MKKYKYVLPLLSSLFLVFSCTSNINTINRDTILNISNRGANIKGKIKLNSFNIKTGQNPQYRARKTLADLKSLKIEVLRADSDTFFSPVTPLTTPFESIINIDNKLDTIDFELKGLPANSTTTEYYILNVYAYDNINASGNIINFDEIPAEPESGFYIHVDNLLNYSFYSEPNFEPILINLYLQDFTTDNTKFNVYKTPTDNEIIDTEIKLNNSGEGLISWIEKDTIANSSKICFKKVKDYIPNDTSTCDTPIMSNISSLYSDIDNSGNGNLFFLNNGNIDGRKINNYIPDTVQNYVNSGGIISSFSYASSQNGTGLLVYSKDHIQGKKAIYTHKVQNYNPVNPTLEGELIYYNGNIVEYPKIALNEKGNGLITWEEFLDTNNTYSISSMKINDYNPPIISGIGTINLSTSSTTVNGTGTEFTKQFYIGSKIKENYNEYTVDSIQNDTQLTLTSFPVSNYSGNYEGLGINKKSIYPYSGTSGNSSFTASLIDSFIKPGLKFSTSSQEFTVNGNIISNSFDTIEAIISNISSSYLYTKEAYSINLPNNYSHRLPSIQLNDSGNGIIAWKVYETSVNPNTQDYIAYQRIKNFNIVDYNGNDYINYAINSIDLKSLEYNSQFNLDLSPVSIRINSFGDGDFFFSAKANIDSDNSIFSASIENYINTVINYTDISSAINPKSSLNQENAGLLLSISNDRKSIDAVHYIH